MEETTLWFNISTFTVIFAALGLNYVRYLQRPSGWRRWYLGYQGAYALYLVLATYTYFKMQYLHAVPPWIDSGMNWLRIFVSLVLLVVAPEFIGRLTGKSWGWKRHLTAVVVFIALIAMLRSTLSLTISTIISSLYNLFFCLLSVYGLRHLRLQNSQVSGPERIPQDVLEPGKRAVQGFLWFSIGCYLLFTLLNSVSFLLTDLLARGFGTLVIGLFCGLWGANDIYWFVRDWSELGTAPSDGVSTTGDALAMKTEDWKISPREQEIIEALIEGATNKEIAERLFISLRTVETHLYNIYRKAGVKNRVELLHKIHS